MLLVIILHFSYFCTECHCKWHSVFPIFENLYWDSLYFCRSIAYEIYGKWPNFHNANIFFSVFAQYQVLRGEAIIKHVTNSKNDNLPQKFLLMWYNLYIHVLRCMVSYITSRGAMNYWDNNNNCTMNMLFPSAGITSSVSCWDAEYINWYEQWHSPWKQNKSAPSIIKLRNSIYINVNWWRLHVCPYICIVNLDEGNKHFILQWIV